MHIASARFSLPLVAGAEPGTASRDIPLERPALSLVSAPVLGLEAPAYVPVTCSMRFFAARAVPRQSNPCLSSLIVALQEQLSNPPTITRKSPKDEWAAVRGDDWLANAAWA